MKILIYVNEKESKIIREHLKSAVINFDEWEKGAELLYKINELIIKAKDVEVLIG